MKRIKCFVLALIMTLSLFVTVPVQATDAVTNSAVFVKQSKSGRCTLASAVMMLRRRAFLEGNENWSSITENSIKSVAWSSGLNWDFTYAGMRVVYGTFKGMSQKQKKTKLLSLLSEHPEGVVIYMYGDGKKTHAVLATDYDSSTGTVYCADPANSIAKGRIPLTSAYLTGSSQDERIGNLRMYWYVKSGNCTLTMPIVTPPVQEHSYSYSNDSAHPHSEYKYCSCGDKEYTGNKKLISTCSACYPVGNVRLTRSFEKTKGTATFYRNNVNNATSYILKLYHNGSYYDEYTMSSNEKTITKLPSGNYTATLYAKNSNTGEERSDSCESFKIVETYTISYNANGGINTPSSHEKLQDDSNFTLKMQAPTKAHYVFKGWARSKNATVAEYQPGDIYNRNAKATLYAVWEPETYTIKFDANGGKGEILDTTITYGDAIRIPNDVICDYSYLKGWSTSKTATTATYKIGMDYKFDADTTLYAVWGTSTWSGGASASLSGSGTEADPYLIQSEADLGYLANKVNNQTSAPEYKYYKLTNNINLAYNEWVPIGLYGNEHQYFYGSFDGNGFTISDLYITKENEKNVGLFGYVKNSVIKNLTVTGAIESITSSNVLNIGSIVGFAENTTLKELHTKYFNIGSIATGTTDYSSIGAIAGKTDNGIIDSCEAYNNNINLKSGKFHTGMIVGCCNSIITNCKVESTQGGLFSTSTTVAHFYMGGLCGMLYNSADRCSVKAPYLSNNLKTSHSTNIGGLVGHLRGTVSVCSVQFNDSNENSITSTGSAPIRIGGFVGFASSDAKITNCKIDGKTISGTTTTLSAYVGGLVGDIESKTNTTIDEDCFVINNAFINIDGDVSAVAKENAYAGSIIGHSSASAESISLNKNIVGVIDNIYSTTTGSGYTAYSGNVIGYNERNKFNFENTYYNTEMNLTSSTNTFDVTSGVARSSKTMSVAFYTELLGLVPYSSLSNLVKDENAVWVLENGKLPELYYNCLNDITISNDIENGSVTIDKTQAVDGEVVNITATPNDGYVLNKVYVDGVEQDGTTFVVDGNDEVYVTFAEVIPVFDVSIAANENASASLVNADAPMLMSVRLMSSEADSSITANDGEEIQVNAVADSDYTVDSIYVNGEEVAGNSFILTEDSVVTMAVTSISTDVTATTNDAEDVGSYFAVVSGSVSGDDENTVKYIRYWSADDTETVYVTAVESGSGDYTTELMDLEPETTYYYQMTEFGEIKSFTTCAEEVDEHIGDEDGDSDAEDVQITALTINAMGLYGLIDVEALNVPDSAEVYIAAYDTDKKLVSVQPVTLTNGAGQIIAPLDKLEKIKAFVWGKNSTSPLCVSKETPIS